MGRRPTMPITSPAKTRQPSESSEPRAEIFQDSDAESIGLAINALFDSSKDMDDSAFTTFVNALCQLSAEMIGMTSVQPAQEMSSPPPTPSLNGSFSIDTSRRRTSGINISHTIKTTERSFGLSKLRLVASLNLSRLASKDASVGWTVITEHLLGVARHATASSVIRTDAAVALGELLSGAMRVGQGGFVQHQVFDVLVLQVHPDPVSTNLATDYEIRAAGFKTLNQILESSGHSLQVGWGTIFDMLKGVCKNEAKQEAVPDTPNINRPTALFSKGDANLVRIAFPSLTLICTDFLTALDSDSMRQCIACLGYFGRQREDVNITLAAIGLLWNVSDAVQGTSKDLWLYLLCEVLDLGQDSRLDVRSGAMQTLFRCIELYGSTLSDELWDEVFWKIIFPLLDSTPGDESQVLALTSIGGICGTFLERLSRLSSFERIYHRLLKSLETIFLDDYSPSSAAAAKTLERLLLAKSTDTALDVDRAWTSCLVMADALARESPYTQESLLALIRVASLLHNIKKWTSDELKRFSDIMRTVMTYSRSPEYRLDVDALSPLQAAVVEATSKSRIMPPSLVLSDLADFSSLAYMGEQSAKVTYVALSKYCMPHITAILRTSGSDRAIYDDGTVESVLGVSHFERLSSSSVFRRILSLLK